jgi:hypothetical protein
MEVLEVRTIALSDQLICVGITWRRLDPDHVGAPVRQRTNTGGAGAGQCQVDDLEDSGRRGVSVGTLAEMRRSPRAWVIYDQTKFDFDPYRPRAPAYP